jgi:hypothetical protein
MYKYSEDKYIQDIQDYVDSTYGQHYVNDGIQVVDVWQARGTLDTTAADTAIKYIMRYGKKEGKNRKDLLKAVHYIMLMMYADDNTMEKKNETRTRTFVPVGIDRS